MMNKIALTEADKQKLKQLNKNNNRAVMIFTIVTSIAALIVVGGFYFTPQATWPSIAILFVVLFAFGTFMAWRENAKIERDIQNGIKEKITGIVNKKTISRGNTTFNYDAATLARAAMRAEETELNKPVTRYGVLDNEVDQTVSHWYGVEINTVNYNIGIRNWLLVKEGDTLKLDVAPKSKRVVSFENISSAATA
jgi:hypothetical protein